MTRTYHYNLNVGENYYTPMTAYLESLDRGAREQSPGALTFDERLYRDWQRGHRYGEYGSKSRASSLTRYEAGNVGSTYVDRWARASTQAPPSRYDGGYRNGSGSLYYTGNTEEYYGHTYSALISSCQRQLDLLKQLNEIRPPTLYGGRSY